MPSAVNKPVQQKPSSPTEEPAGVGQVATVIEKKIRNLEKRKQRLDGYREDHNQGKKLSEPQLEAISHIPDVEQQLDSARDLLKQVQQIAQEYNRQQKLKRKQEQKDRAQAEQTKLKELLQIQDILNIFGGEQVRADFKTGKSGALKLSEAMLLLLDGLYSLIVPSREKAAEAGKTFPVALEEASLHAHALLTGSAKPIEINGATTTYKELRKLVNSIIQCSYFSDQPDDRSITPAGNQESSASSTCEPPVEGGGDPTPDTTANDPAAGAASADNGGHFHQLAQNGIAEQLSFVQPDVTPTQETFAAQSLSGLGVPESGQHMIQSEQPDYDPHTEKPNYTQHAKPEFTQNSGDPYSNSQLLTSASANLNPNFEDTEFGGTFDPSDPDGSKRAHGGPMTFINSRGGGGARRARGGGAPRGNYRGGGGYRGSGSYRGGPNQNYRNRGQRGGY